MLEKRFKSGLATIVLLIAAVLLVSCWPSDEKEEEKNKEKRRIAVAYEAGSKQISLNDYITGVICNFDKWIDLDNENAEMVKVLAILIRTDIASVMQEKDVIAAEKLPFKYDGCNLFIKNYGKNAQEKIDFIRKNVDFTDGFALKSELSFIYCGYYESTQGLKNESDSGLSLATAREMTRQGKSCEEVLKKFFPNLTMAVDFN